MPRLKKAGVDAVARLFKKFSAADRILRDEADLESWLAKVRASIMEKLPNGPVQI